MTDVEMVRRMLGWTGSQDATTLAYREALILCGIEITHEAGTPEGTAEAVAESVREFLRRDARRIVESERKP